MVWKTERVWDGAKCRDNKIVLGEQKFRSIHHLQQINNVFDAVS